MQVKSITLSICKVAQTMSIEKIDAPTIQFQQTLFHINQVSIPHKHIYLRINLKQALLSSPIEAHSHVSRKYREEKCISQRPTGRSDGESRPSETAVRFLGRELERERLSADADVDSACGMKVKESARSTDATDGIIVHSIAPTLFLLSSRDFSSAFSR